MSLCIHVAKPVVVKHLDTVTELQVAAAELCEDSIVFR